MGGSLYYRSGWLFERLAIEVEGFTSQPIVAPDGRDGTLLLAPGQKGYSVLGVANAKFRHRDLTLTGYRQELDTPYLNRQDNRMTPNTFEALKLERRAGWFKFGAGYAWRFKARNSDHFEPLSHRAGVSKDRGAAFWNLLFTPRENLHVGASGYVVPDVIATTYVEGATTDFETANGVGVRVDAQSTIKNTSGDELIAGAPFQTWNLGLRTAASWRGVVGRLAFAVTGDERRIETFYGSSPSYLSLMLRTYNRADEKALLASLSQDFSYLGLPNLTALATFAQGWGARVAGERFDEREVNLTLDYRIPSGWLESFWLRVRGAWGERVGADGDDVEVRVIVRYELPAL